MKEELLKELMAEMQERILGRVAKPQESPAALPSDEEAGTEHMPIDEGAESDEDKAKLMALYERL